MAKTKPIPPFPSRIPREEPTIQRLLWIPKGEDKPGIPVKQVPLVPYPYYEKPDRLWTLYTHQDPEAPPELPYRPFHHHNAFLEDEIHDWNVIQHNTMLHYASRASDGGNWALLLFHKPPKLRG